MRVNAGREYTFSIRLHPCPPGFLRMIASAGAICIMDMTVRDAAEGHELFVFALADALACHVLSGEGAWS